MKKSQHLFTINIIAFMLLWSADISAQDLYTKSGTDLTWNQVKDQNKEPSASGGLKGSDIDVNQDHPLISSSPYKDRTIQQNIAIHTIANGTVPRSDFNKWTRWYQEDGNTQVFRMFKGEVNIGNDIYYKPRIEAELKAHSKGLNINNGADWVEWSGTYTFVQPVDAHIFQIWSNDDYVLMLSMKNNGKVQLNPRDQSGFKTILENGTGKSVHIRVRDYGDKYEVFVDGKKFYSRNYTAKYGSKRAAHFRWGIYAARKKGDRGGVPQDGMMFVTGAQRRFSNDVVEPEPEPVPNAIGPDGYTYSVDESETVQISEVPYDVAYGQDGQYAYLLKQTENVSCDNTTFGNDPASGIEKYCFIRESKAPYSGVATTIPGTIEAENYDYGGAGRSYKDDDTENRGDLNFRENQGVDIDNGPDGAGLSVGWIRTGEWLEYTVNVSQDGMYEINFFVASPQGTGVLGLDIDGEELLTGLQTPQTGGWDTYNSFSANAQLSKGEHVIRLNVEQNGFNIDKIEITNSTLGINGATLEMLSLHPNPSKTGVFNLPRIMHYTIHSIQGKVVLKAHSNKVNLASFPAGLYILRAENAVAKLMVK